MLTLLSGHLMAFPSHTIQYGGRGSPEGPWQQLISHPGRDGRFISTGKYPSPCANSWSPYWLDIYSNSYTSPHLPTPFPATLPSDLIHSQLPPVYHQSHYVIIPAILVRDLIEFNNELSSLVFVSLFIRTVPYHWRQACSIGDLSLSCGENHTPALELIIGGWPVVTRR